VRVYYVQDESNTNECIQQYIISRETMIKMELNRHLSNNKQSITCPWYNSGYIIMFIEQYLCVCTLYKILRFIDV